MAVAQRPDPGTNVQRADEAQPRGIVALLDSEAARRHIEPLLPKGVEYRRVMATVAVAARTNPDLLKCEAWSIVTAVAKIQQWGLEIGETAHLVPFKGKVTPIADYKGLAHLLRVSGAVRHLETRCVYEGDEFEYEQGLEPKLRHVPSTDVAKRGKLRGAYVVIRLPFGQSSFEYMPIEDIEAIRKQYSKQWGPDKVKECPAWYAKKTVVRQAAKLLPKTGKLAEAMRVIDDDTELEFAAQGETLTATARLLDEDRIEPPASDFGEELPLDDRRVEPPRNAQLD